MQETKLQSEEKLTADVACVDGFEVGHQSASGCWGELPGD